MTWEITLDQVEVMARVGILPHEHEPQRLWVDVRMEVDYAATPTHISECTDYAVVYNHIQAWADAPHTPLLETRVQELCSYILGVLPQVTAVTCRVSKPDIFSHAHAVGVSLTVSRAR